MFDVQRQSDHRVDIHVSGAIDAAAMRAGLDALVDASMDVRNGLMLYRIENITMPTPGAMMVEFARLPQLIALIGRFDRAAVCSDVAWVRRAAEVEGRLIPGLKIKAFELDEVGAAEAWLDT